MICETGTLLIKDVVVEDFVNYKKPAMFIIFPNCSFKCDKESGKQLCQNSSLAKQPNKQVGYKTIINNYINNDITKAIVFGGLEPFDSYDEMLLLIKYFRAKTNDDIVIYTGYNKCEITDKLKPIASYSNIIVKFGRFIPDNKKHYDDILGVYLASDNQYAEYLSS